MIPRPGLAQVQPAPPAGQPPPLPQLQHQPAHAGWQPQLTQVWQDAGFRYIHTPDIPQVGYSQNDAYTAYISMGSPVQLTRAQEEILKAQATGKPEQKNRRRSAA